MQPLKTHTIVLRRTNYGEADRILQLLMPDGHKIGAIAKGVRREKSKLAGAVELFCVSEVTIHRGKNDLGTLTSARLKTFFGDILTDYGRLQFGYEVLKKISRLAEHTEDPALYDITHMALTSLNQTGIDLRIISAWFYLQIAEISGHGLNLSRDVNNQFLSVDKKYKFDIADMSFVSDKSGNFTSEHLKLLKILKLKTPDVVAHVSGIEAFLDDCLSLAHAVAE